MAKAPVTPPKGPTLQDALNVASSYWAAKGASSRMMPIRAAVGVTELGSHLELASLTAAHGTQLLTGLRKRGLSQASLIAYYAAFRRMLSLNGVSTVPWPGAGVAPRRVREPLSEADVERLRGWLAGRRYTETASLLELIYATGMRVDVEALETSGQCEWVLSANEVWITGKGGHQRRVPVEDASRLAGKQFLAKRVPYATHLERWNKAVKALGITSKKPTPHAVRHLFATKAYAKSKDLLVVKELLGHSDVATTAGYIGVDMEKLREAVS